MASWLENLPPIQGRYQTQALMSQQTWFQVGGAADLLVRPKNVEDLITFLQYKPAEVPLTVIGAGSNILVRDGGISGAVLRLGRGFANLHFDGVYLTVGAAALDRTVALMCADKGLAGLEFLIGVPGTIGGALKMNAGCYGQEIKDVLVWADVVDLKGNIIRLSHEDFGFTYRHSSLPSNCIIIRACFKLQLEPPERLHQRLVVLLEQREKSQPVKGRTGGSTFKNPPHHHAWSLIDEVGGRGLRRGDAQFSEKHCNFLLNLGKATAKDLEDLGEEVRQRVLKDLGVSLEWEIIRLGKKGEE